MDPGRMNLCRGGPFGPPFAFSRETPGVSENRARELREGDCGRQRGTLDRLKSE